jgi:creatinine amidohydrolase/Fe(II)-dependent formamide hydrolase-like protein
MIALIPVWKTNSPGTGWSKALAKHDWHAGWLETSLVMALEPDLVRMQDLELDPEPLLSQQIDHPDHYQQAEKIADDPLVIPRMSQRPEIKVGVMGHPETAGPELGKKVVEDILKNLCEKIQKLEAGADGIYKKVKFVPEPLIF